MSRGRLLQAAAAAVVFLAIAVASSDAARTDVSSNWAGYVATGIGSTASTASASMTYTDVTGQWVQPRATCKRGIPTSVAIWVGLGGYSESSQALDLVCRQAHRAHQRLLSWSHEQVLQPNRPWRVSAR